MVWTTKRLFVQNSNPKCAGRISLKGILTVSGTTRLAKNNCDIVDGPWRLMITDEALQKVVDFTNIKTNKCCELMTTPLTEINKKM